MDTPRTSADVRTAPGPGPSARLPGWARALLAMALLLPVASTAVLPSLVPGVGAAMERPDAVGLAAYALVCAVPLAAYLLVSWALVRVVDRRPFSALGLAVDVRAAAALGAGIGLAIVLGVVAGLVSSFLAAGDTATPGPAAGTGGEGEGLAALLVLLGTVVLRAFVLQGIGEEVLFRGYLMQSLSRRPVTAVLVSAVVFTVPHLASNGGQSSALEHVLYLATPFGFALSAGVLAIALRSVWAAVGIHGGFHLATVVLVILGLGVTGPAFWLASGAVHALAAVVIALAIPRRRWAEVGERGPYAR
ncbi:CPBP family intramembrane glutamic endopeptidase [Brachybacterium sp. YJGR34]|uniref:CPBP family intramembrane glutamic endopeptidase n=1 Tax=Brachybacterium sp. YJGR34 TaxID=2059911 RepID=UPI000E0C57AE|nr:CPBP family intramembrane glutamic endopeptidase [Brachybacterium sp. YJGR34]